MVDTPPVLSRKIGPKNQLNLPAEYMTELGMQQGDYVYIGVNPDKPGTLVVIPESRMRALLEKGWTSIA